jgi:thiol-disulfide isomerase/thioredoxin
LIFTVGLAAFALALLLLYQYALRPSSDHPVLQVTVAPDLPEFAFTPHDEPRRLPDFAFTDGDELELTLADFSGRVVLLNIWATWCPPCRREMPALDRLQAAMGGPDFEVIALSIDTQGASVVRDYYQELELQALAVYIGHSSRVPSKLGVVGIPTTLLIDHAGREIGRIIGAAEWDGPEANELIRRYVERARLGRVPDATGPMDRRAIAANIDKE